MFCPPYFSHCTLVFFRSLFQYIFCYFDQHDHLGSYAHKILDIVLFTFLQVSVSLYILLFRTASWLLCSQPFSHCTLWPAFVFNNYLVIANWIMYTTHDGRLFSSHFFCLGDISHQLIFTSLCYLFVSSIVPEYVIFQYYKTQRLTS